MSMPTGLGIIDTMIGFPIADRKARYEFITRQTKDSESKDGEFPAEYMFRDIPPEHDQDEGDPVDVTLREMDRHGIELAMVDTAPGEIGLRAVQQQPDRFIPALQVDPNDGMDAVRAIQRQFETLGIRAVTLFPVGCLPQVPIDGARMYPIYAKCCELGLPVFCTAGVPGPRVPYAAQAVELIDRVMFDFPELVFITRHGCEPWTELMVKLMLKWPNLYYSTSAFAPKYYPKEIVDYANTRGAEKILYAGYYPFGLSLERIAAELPHVPFRDHVWAPFLRGNAARVLGLPQG